MSDAKKPAKKAASETKKKAKKIVVSDESTDVVQDAAVEEVKELEIQDFAEEAKDRSVANADKADIVVDEPEDNDTDEGAETPDIVIDEDLDAAIENEPDLKIIEDEPDTDSDDDTTETDKDPSEAEETEDEKHQHEIEELQHEAEDLAETEEEMLDESKKTIEQAMREADLKEEAEDVDFGPDPEVDKAVDEIVRREGDTQIESDDAALVASAAGTSKKSKMQKIKGFFAAWWRNKIARYGTLVGLLAIIVAVVVVPGLRYGVLNTAGVRVEASLTVVDDKTRLPLRDISVMIQGNEATSNEQGMVMFNDLKLGDTQLKIMKRGYADVDRTITLGWGSNPLGANGIVATGEQYQFELVHWLTGEPVTENAEAVAGENSATADESGSILLTIGEDNLSQVEVAISADGYRTETVKILELDQEKTTIMMVSDRKHAFISNRSGNYDVYSIDLDGENEQLIVPATEKERETPVLSQHPSKNIAAFVSSRSGETNDDGFKFDELYILNIETGDLDRLLRSEQLRIVGWSADTLVYSQVIEGTSAGNPQRSKLFSYNTQTSTRTELAAANYFNDVELVNETLYYAVSSFAVPVSQAKLFSVPITGGDSQVAVDDQVWNLFRTEYDKILVSAQDQKWYELVDGQSSEIERQQTPSSRSYLDSPSGQASVWTETRDGKGTILMRNTAGEESVVFASPGLSSVLYWVDETTLLYRVISSSETADYLLNLAPKDSTELEPVKLRDVTANQRFFF